MVSAEEVDGLLRQLERDTDRQVATAGSSVKGVAAERDLLRSAEQSRDLLLRAVKGEKDALDKVFGGDCERIGRYRYALDRVTISDMHAKDRRWPDLRDVVETIEAVLKDLGTFKPWVPPAVRAPARIVYRGLRRRLSPGRRINLKPEVEGGEVASYEVDPPLPASLELSGTTGVISGSLQQLVSVAETTYIVVGRNENGEARVELTFSVAESPPVAVGYPDSSEKRKVLLGEELSLRPEIRGNSPSKWKVQPPLPTGIILDPESGSIHGSPVEVREAVEYEVTASNDGGQVSTVVNLEVLLCPPSDLCYPELAEKLWAGKPVQLEPAVKGAPSKWSAEPQLPDGLEINEETGVISGAPTQVAEEAVWQVMAGNAAGDTTCQIAFSVQLAPPEALAYPEAEGESKEFPVLRPLAISPRFDGVVDEFSVEPALPTGLALDSETGNISGTPSEVTPETSYEVTARNASGATAAALVFAVQLGPPVNLDYPSLDPLYTVGEEVTAAAQVQGGPTQFAIDPALPEGLTLDELIGEIRGAPRALVGETTYVVTASNEAGEAFKEISFTVVAPAPADLSYPSASSTFAVGEPVLLEPSLEGWLEGTFEVDPPLPEGLAIEPTTGVISGTSTEVCSESTYVVTARNSSGSTSVELTFAIIETVQSEAVADSINKDFAAKLEAVTDIADMLPEPAQIKAFGDWMIWMVHRAYLDDPTLTELNFNNLHMPDPIIEERISPKLMKALETNTHIEVLSLVNSNLMKKEGVALAGALEVNKTLRTLNLECNNLDSNAVREIAVAVAKNSEAAVEHLRLTPQKQVGNFFGRPVEEAVGLLMERNNSIIKLGFECNDAHWRNLIDRALLRNNDFARKNRKRNRLATEEEVQSEERILSRLTLQRPPDLPAVEVFADDSPPQIAFRSFVAQQKRLPNATQLQNFARNSGNAMKYSEVAPTLKECRARMLDAAVKTEVTVADCFEVDTQGVLRSWSSTNNTWSLDIRTPDGKRFEYKTDKELVLIVSESWAGWLSALRA